LAAWAGGDLLAAESSTPPERVVVSADGFSGYAADYARSKGFGFTDDAAKLLHQVAEESANQIFASPELSRDGLIADAKSTFKKLVDAMIESSKEIPGYAAKHPGKLGGQTYEGAKKKLCPIWPVCTKRKESGQ